MFDCWQFLSLIPFSSLSAPHLGKLIRKPGYFLLWGWGKVQITQAPTLAWESLPQPHSLTILRIPSQSPFLVVSSHSWTCLRAFPIFPMSRDINNKPFHNLLVCVGHYQPRHPNQNLTWESILLLQNTVTEGTWFCSCFFCLVFCPILSTYNNALHIVVTQ